MRDHSRVSPAYWTGETGSDIRRRGRDPQLVGAYLMTAPGANMLGVFHLPIATLASAICADEEGLARGLQDARKALRSLSEAGFCTYDENLEWVWVHEMAAWQVDDYLEPSDNRVKGIAKMWLSLPKLPFLNKFFERYAEPFHLPTRPETARRASPLEDPSKPGAGAGTEEETDSALSAKRSAPAPVHVEHSGKPKAEPTAGGRNGSSVNGTTPVAAAVALSPVVITLPLNTGKPWEVHESWVKDLEVLYPAVDVRQQLRSMLGWLDAKPQRRKTARGIKAFVTGWLSREQDRAPRNGASGAATAAVQTRKEFF